MTAMPEPTPEDGISYLLEERSTIAMPALTVHVDFVELQDSVGTERAFELIGQLKDLLS
jgi:hypothetical protein